MTFGPQFWHLREDPGTYKSKAEGTFLGLAGKRERRYCTQYARRLGVAKLEAARRGGLAPDVEPFQTAPFGMIVSSPTKYPVK